MTPAEVCTTVICPNTIWWELIKGIPTALATLTIGGVAAYIAYRQYRVAHAKFKLDLFEKRFVIYQAVVRALSSIEQSNNVYSERPTGLSSALRADTSAAQFLFDDDVAAFIESLIEKADVAGNATWAAAEKKTIAGRFRPYMNMSHWR
ncbi:hypothetical protein LGM46_29325 [Burkholderia arboris]|uniref:hypothetical protein n=1 Tax=Burkholderia arboris TaxID=488730 RepID=UPI001CF2B70C|nr:hypothetical protein [Burkholderia arboris]MCA8037073.1 hypothetical protein [Burkholderia arboris]